MPLMFLQIHGNSLQEREIPQNCQLRDTAHQNNTEHHSGKSCHTFRDKTMMDAMEDSWKVDDKGFFHTFNTQRSQMCSFWDKFGFQPPDNTALHSHLELLNPAKTSTAFKGKSKQIIASLLKSEFPRLKIVWTKSKSARVTSNQC